MDKGKEYVIGNKAKDLLMYTMKITQNTNLFPKRVRFTYVQDLQKTVKRILKNIHSANECMFNTEHQKRLALLKDVLDDCNFMLTLIEISLELEFIDMDRTKHWTQLVLNVKYMAASWKKKDGQRAETLIQEAKLREVEERKAEIREIVREVMSRK